MKVGVVAGEASGDVIGALMIRALKARWPELEFVGIAGPKMQAAGATSWYPMEKLAVRGYLEVLKSLRELLSMRAELGRRMIEARPALFVGIDAPDFNLKLERRLKQAGIPSVHYVSPSIWAWRGERIHSIRESVDHMLTVFPFEPAIYAQAGVPATFVGHPTADQIPQKDQREEARAQLRLKPSDLVFALLPGSRQSELDYHAELFLETAKRLHAAFPHAKFLVPLTTRETREQFEAAKWKCGAQDLPLQVLFGHANFALAAADAALIASGTATLEAAMLRCPHVIAYRLSNATYRLMKRKAYLPWVGLPNILANAWLVPELLQHEATPDNLARALGNWVRHPDAAKTLRERFDAIHASLAVDNAARVCEALAPYIERPAGARAA
ncbi:MAG: lipid-A-disaccharide synthase [Betaproteobacteria bacterium]|nr:lipid-A-disaccharide synthase [Betaproteobacteria bacterium]